MDKLAAVRELKRLYNVEEVDTDLVSERDYLDIHLSIILGQGDGVWDDKVAKDYLRRLSQTIAL